MFLNKLSTLIAVLVTCACIVLGIRFSQDHAAPVITAEGGNVKLGCAMNMDNLLNQVTIDDRNLKASFTEEDSVMEVLEKGRVTYVAIDDSNNVAKKTVYIDADKDVKDFKIVTLQQLKVQLNSEFNIHEYFAVQNKCGWTIDTGLSIEDLDVTKEGTYEVVVKAGNDITPLRTKIVVKDMSTPIITLSKDEIEVENGAVLTRNMFKDLITSIEDDKDTESSLLRNITIDYDNINTVYSGRYTVTYSVEDSDGHTGTAKLVLKVNAPVYQNPWNG